jgi:Ca2+-binding RTX toxin-like protein
MPLREVEGTGFERVEGTNESEGLDEGTINGVVDGLYISDGWGGIRAKGGNDTLSATATNGWGYGHEIHTYAGAGDDVTYLDFGLITIFSAGHHARGGSRDAMTYGEQFNTDDPFDLDDHIIPVDAHTNSRVLSEGADTFVFQNLHNIQDVVVGRLEDLDHSQDQVYIGAVSPNNLIDFSSGSGTINGHSWRIVEWNGEHLDPNADPQQWLLIETSGGGTLLYAIEGARVDNSDIESPGDYQEHHFVSEVPTRAFLATNPQGVGFVDPVNFVPVGYLPDAGGLYLDDFDVDQADVDAEISGTNVGDVIAAGLNDDLVSANGGDDTVWGGSGSDTINGNGGNDLLFGNTGDDSLSGGDGADSIQGEEGSDTINGNGGNDLLFGNTGDDSLSGGDGADSIQGEEGSDTIYGNAGNDSLKGQQGDDAVWGENGHDTIKGGWGNDTLGGGAGNDSLYGGGDDDVIWTGAGQNYAQGDAGNDKIEGGSSSDTIYGGEGNDTLYGWGGDDTMKGGAENDILDGNGGNDYLDGEAGNDKL